MTMGISELCAYYCKCDNLETVDMAKDVKTLAKELQRRLDEDKALEIDIQRIMANLPPLKPGKGSVALNKLRELTGMPVGPIYSVLEKAAELLESSGTVLQKARRGERVATAIWQWLQVEERVEYVPWAVKNDPLVAGKQAERKELLYELRERIKEASNVS